MLLHLFLPNILYEHKQQVAEVKGREGVSRESEGIYRVRGMKRENGVRQAKQKEVK